MPGAGSGLERLSVYAWETASLPSAQLLALEAGTASLFADARLAGKEGDSPLAYLRREVERIRRREVGRSLRLHPDLPPEKLDTITRSLVNQIFHVPYMRLRRSEDPELADAVAALFRSRSEEAADDGY